MNSKLYLYSFLAQFRLLKKSYTAKIFLVAFLGTHVPLLTLIVSFVTSNSYSWEMAVQVLLTALVATLVGTVTTLYTLRYLLAPVIATSAALQEYLQSQKLPKLPTKFTDEVGTLMADTSQTLYKLDELIHQITYYDNLTGLPNRDLFSDRLYNYVSNSHNQQQLVAVLVLGIDDFVDISHGLEPETLNLLLRAVAQRLTSHQEKTDILAFLGQDEFAIARTDLISFEGVVKLSELLVAIVGKPFSINGQQIHITASIGITINSVGEQANVEQLLQQAHMALYQAKQQGRGQHKFYSPQLNAQLQERLALENDLHEALERGEMIVYYQPLVDLRTKEITALEALVRWQHPTRGLVSPGQFIPIAENNGLIVPIGEWVLRTACAQNRTWQLAGIPPIRISVNLSARQFEQPNLVEVVRQTLAQTGLSATYLELEVTESFLMGNVQQSIKTLKQLRELGVWIALDDFGTGYSSLNYLKSFPVHMLKIDRSFVQDVTVNPESAAVTNAVIALAQSLQLKITAEGVETQEQLNYLQTQGCQEAQGYYFGIPSPAEKITDILKANCPQMAA
ncbi:putative bifunctional diguanylate cyclase/phosphodiesterase [Nostoc sp. CENA543]|uniref:putative bifunctional diguanylate cyclase/phosphodiesterase n=1 Tax=Nostoc sp. CENA543 TaxID=1869241 RepID=UPI00268F4D3C